jgi:hypothetical protein
LNCANRVLLLMPREPGGPRAAMVGELGWKRQRNLGGRGSRNAGARSSVDAGKSRYPRLRVRDAARQNAGEEVVVETVWETGTSAWVEDAGAVREARVEWARTIRDEWPAG